MKKSTRYQLCVLLINALLLLSACQSNPSSGSVSSKNDGAFDANVIVSAEDHRAPGTTHVLAWDEEFQSSDGSITYLARIDTIIDSFDMPVVKVTPHHLTESDAKRIAHALFGDVNFYEAPPMLAPIYSKSEIRDKIERWAEYASMEAVYSLYGEERESSVELVKRFIERYTEQYETAPEDSPYPSCHWEYKKDTYYLVSEAEAASTDTSNDNDNIQATVSLNGVKYLYKVATRDKKDFKINNITAFLYDGIGPDFIDDRIFQAKLCRTGEPTAQVLKNVKDSTEKILAQMELGTWKIDQCYVETQYYGETPEYIINVTAVPVFNGVPAVRQNQISNLKSEDSYASNYYLTDANFRFSANNELVEFNLMSPVDVAEVINNNVAVMSSEQLKSIVKDKLILTDYRAYDTLGITDIFDAKIACKVTISSIEYGLSRVKVPNTDESYYYVPALSIYGQPEYSNPDSGEVFYSANEPILLLTINTVDGTLINTRQ